jgi:primosomal protein N'
MSVIAWGGNVTAAHRALTAEGIHAPTYSTLLSWVREKYLDKYNELREKYSAQLEAQLAHEYRDVARQAVDVQRLALEKATQRLSEGKDVTPSRTAADAATVADKMTGKLLSLTGRPTSIREDRNLNEILRSLVGKGVIELAPEQVQQHQVQIPVESKPDG